MGRETELPVRNDSRDKHDGVHATLSARECVPVCITDTVADSSIGQSVTIFSSAPMVFKESGSKEAVRTLNLSQKITLAPVNERNPQRAVSQRVAWTAGNLVSCSWPEQLDKWHPVNVATGATASTSVQQGCARVLQGRGCYWRHRRGGEDGRFRYTVIQLLSEEPYGVFCLCLAPTARACNSSFGSVPCILIRNDTSLSVCHWGRGYSLTGDCAYITPTCGSKATRDDIMEHLLHGGLTRGYSVCETAASACSRRGGQIIGSRI